MMHLTPHQIVTSAVPIKGQAARIIRWAARRYGVSSADMIGPGRERPVVHARMVAMNLIFRHPRCRHLSLTSIGRMFGNRHWATVIHALHKMGGPDRYEREMSYRIGSFNAPRSNWDAGDAGVEERRAEARLRAKQALARIRAARRADLIEPVFMDRAGLGMKAEQVKIKYRTAGETVRGIVTEVITRAVNGDCAAIRLVERATGRDRDYAIPNLIKRFSSLPGVKELRS